MERTVIQNWRNVNLLQVRRDGLRHIYFERRHIGDTYPIGKIWNGVGNISEILRNRKISVEDEDGEIYTLFFRIIKKKSQILRTTVEIIDAD